MATVPLIEYAQASPEVRAVYDDIMATRKTDRINNFWKALASHPPTLRRTWESVKEVMTPGALDALTKEMIYLAVSASNGCDYCISSHTASAALLRMSVIRTPLRSRRRWRTAVRGGGRATARARRGRGRRPTPHPSRTPTGAPRSGAAAACSSRCR